MASGKEMPVSVTLVSGAEVALQPVLEEETVRQLRQRIAEALAMPCGQVALLCGVDLLRDCQKMGTLPRAGGLCEVTVMVSKKWDEKLQECLVNQGHFTACALASLSDGELFAWSKGADVLLRCRDTQHEGQKIQESECLKYAMEHGCAPEYGLWLGGARFRILRYDKEDEPFTTLLAVSTAWRRDGLGIVGISTGSNMVLCRFEAPGEQLLGLLGGLRKAAAAFGDLMCADGL